MVCSVLTLTMKRGSLFVFLLLILPLSFVNSNVFDSNSGNVDVFVECPDVTGQCVKAFIEWGQPKRALVHAQPLTWDAAVRKCAADLPGHSVLHTIGTAQEELGFNAGKLVPYGVFRWKDQEGGRTRISWVQKGVDGLLQDVNESDLAAMESLPNTEQNTKGALDLSTGRWHFVDDRFEFDFVLCQMQAIPDVTRTHISPIPPSSCPVTEEQYFLHGGILHEITLRTDMHVEPSEPFLTQLGANLSAFLETSAQSRYIGEGMDPYWGAQTLKYEVRLDKVSAASRRLSFEEYVVGGEVRVRDTLTCLSEEFGYLERDSTRRIVSWNTSSLGTIAVFVTPDNNGYILRRECACNALTNKAEWTPVTYWQIVPTPCTLAQQLADDDKHRQVQTTLLRTPFNDFSRNLLLMFGSCRLNDLATLVDRLTNLGDDLADKDLENGFFVNMMLDPGLDYHLASRSQSHLLVSDVTASDPVVGFALVDVDVTDFEPVGWGKVVGVDIVRSSHSAVPNVTFSLRLSDKLAAGFVRVSFTVRYKSGTVGDDSRAAFNRWMPKRVAVKMVMSCWPEEKCAWNNSNGGGHFYDVAYQRRGISIVGSDTSTPEKMLALCGAIGCNDLRAWRNESNVVCRCDGAKFVSVDGRWESSVEVDLFRVSDAVTGSGAQNMKVFTGTCCAYLTFLVAARMIFMTFL